MDKEMHCKVCGEIVRLFEKTQFCGKFDVDLWACDSCHYIFADPVFWLEEVYASPINLTDAGYVWRNEYAACILKPLVNQVEQGDYFLDYGSGFGLFVRMMRDRGLRFHWMDPYCDNLFARGFEADIGKVGKYRMATAFEVFEHVENPTATVAEIASLADSLLFSTELIPDGVESVDSWSYFGVEHGQHISFYSPKALEVLASTVGWTYCKLSPGWHFFGSASDPFLDTFKRFFSPPQSEGLIRKVLRRLGASAGGVAPDPNAGLLQEDYLKLKKHLEQHPDLGNINFDLLESES